MARFAVVVELGRLDAENNLVRTSLVIDGDSRVDFAQTVCVLKILKCITKCCFYIQICSLQIKLILESNNFLKIVSGHIFFEYTR